MTCINFNPVYDPSSSASYAAILNGADVTSTTSFQRSVDLSTGDREPSWCLQDDVANAIGCGLPQGSITSGNTVTLNQDAFGVYGCRAERYNWTTEMSTMFIRNDAHFNPEHFTVTVSLDEEVTLVMNTSGSSGGTGPLIWRVNREDGGQSDATSGVSGNKLYISKANKADHGGIHHYFFSAQPDQGGLMRLIVRGCLDSLWGPDCQYACPTCYNGGMCDDVSGRCVCPPGFSGDHCQIACEAGKFGQNCEGSCSSLESGRTNCRGAVFCLPDPYGCSCAAGWSGLECDQACPVGSYGAGCTQTCHCNASSGSCDSVTGACSNGCETGWTGDQCQVTIVDITAMLQRAGVDDVNDNFLGIFMIGGSSLTGDPSLKYYIGREVDTGAGETGHGASSGRNGGDITTLLTDTGLPQGTTLGFSSQSKHHSLRSTLKNSGGDARVGAYRMSVKYKGATEQNILLNEYRGDSSSEVWPEKLSTTVGIGEMVNLGVFIKESTVDVLSLRWRHNGGSEITDWNGKKSVTINDIRKSDDGIYECYVEGNRDTGRHAILRLIVRSCPSSKYGFNCSQDCPACYAGGVCHDVTGECVCRAGFQGNNCDIPCTDNDWGRSCTVVCSESAGNCPNRLFAPPDPVGMACINGYTGNRCQSECGAGYFGADCEMKCNCNDGACSRESGCTQSSCLSGYGGVYCQALADGLQCPSGYFGLLCNYPCHCNGGGACNRSTGQCPDGCADGWAGSDCQQALPRLLESPVVFDITSDSVLLIWNAWTDGYDYGNGPIHSYQIDYDWMDDEGNTGQSDEPVIVFGDSTADVTGLFAFRDYDFYVSVRRKVDGGPVAGVSNGPVHAKTDCGAPLRAPEILSVEVNGISSITITWQLHETPSSSWLQCDSSVYSFNLTYLAYDDPSTGETIKVDGNGPSSYTQTVDRLATCTEYIFSVVVVNSVDLPGPADEATAMTDKIGPEPVDDASTSSNSYDHLEITWSKPNSSCGDPSYIISRRLLLADQCDNSTMDIVEYNATDQTRIEYDDLLPYSTYEFTVLATLDGYDAETVHTFTQNSSESIPTAGPQEFTADNTVKGTLSYTWSIPPCGSRNGAISYDYSLTKVDGSIVESGTVTTTSKSTEGLEHYVEYNFTLCARTNVGRGPCVSEQTRTLPSEPTRPQNLGSNEESTNQTYTVITWDEPEKVNGILERYEIQKNMEAIIGLGREERIYSFSDLEPDTEYDIKVRAVSNGGTGEWAPTTVTTRPIPVPETPSRPNATDTGQTYISIQWEHVNEVELGIYTISHYIISVTSSQSTGDGETYDATNITSPMVYTIGSLQSGTEYFIRVRAVNEGGRGEWSESLTETTRSPPGPPVAAIAAGVSVSLILIIVVSLGFVFYRRRRDAPAPPPKEFDLEGVKADENGGTSSPRAVPSAAAAGASNGKPLVKPAVKPRPPQYHPILISNLAKFVKVRRLAPGGFEKEFQDLLSKSDEGCFGNKPENKQKNRYKNVVTYDEHRVKLNKLPTEPGADYINATFIEGYKKENAFIASQGPNSASLNDFWQMVYEQRTATIVMLTNLVENNKTKCLEYWPASGSNTQYGELAVIAKEVEERGSYILRKFEVGKPGRKFHEVSQYHYTIWPDMGVPESSQPLIDFRDIVKAANPPDAGPTVVHCSAGAGRTGTYITIDSMMEMIEAEKKIDVFNFVNNMRKRRAFMVQVQLQYEFIYETLLQWSVCKKVSFNIIDLPVTIKKWRTKDASLRTEMSKQFEVLEYIAPRESIGSDQRGSLPVNVKKNRFPNKVPVDKFQPLLMTEGDSSDDNDYINASFFDVEGQKNAHVCTQCPLKNTIGDFWRLVWDYELPTIIHLNEMDSTCGQYWPDRDRVNFGPFTVELLSDKKHSDTMTERILRVTSSSKKGERQISMFQYLGWPKGSLVPSSGMGFFDLLMQADNNNASEKRFLVVCMDGVGASPTCLAAIAAIDKVKEDKTVDVFSAVKRLRKSRPGVVDELERYEFCFDVVAAYQDSVQTYANYM